MDFPLRSCRLVIVTLVGVGGRGVGDYTSLNRPYYVLVITPLRVLMIWGLGSRDLISSLRLWGLKLPGAPNVGA